MLWLAWHQWPVFYSILANGSAILDMAWRVAWRRWLISHSKWLGIVSMSALAVCVNLGGVRIPA